MAIFFEGQSTCSICDGVLDKTREHIAWNAFLGQSHPLWKYSDSGMHMDCFQNWEHKEEFNFLYKFQPTVDFDSPDLQEMIAKFGMPPWLEEVKAFRASLGSSDTN